MSLPVDASVGAPADYRAAAAAFRFEDAARCLTGSLHDGLNACIECCDRHVAGGAVALDHVGADGARTRLTFAELRDRSARFAGVLTDRGIRPGDVVAVFCRARPTC